jgi:Bacterial Ig domain/Purple acid Phosphatase, N-terminal domain
MRLTLRSVVVVAAMIVIGLWARPTAAQFPGGFIVKSYNAPNRPRLTPSQIQSFVPAGRGKFTFPSPYNTSGVRITIPTDCGGADCVDYVGYSYWKNINNHQNSDTMYIVLGLNRNRGGTEGPTLFTYNKVTDAVTKVGALFDPATKWSWASANGWYFSATQPTKLYVNYWGDPTLFRYDVVTHTFQQIFDISSRTDIFGSSRNITQFHSSDDDKVHSFTVQDSSFNGIGCGVYHEDTKTFQYFPAVGTYDECNLDASGRWLIIVEGGADLDNHVIDLQTNTEKVILNSSGRLGHLDMGDSYAVGNSGSVPLAQATLLYKFPLATTTYPIGPYEFYNADWSTSYVNHISHQNRKAGVAPEQQYACGSNLDSNPSRENEIACFRLDSSYDALVVAPVMTDMNAPGGGDSYAKYPKGNIDITGQYFIWTSNMYGNRLDAFIAKIPSQLLTGTTVPPSSTSTLSISSVSAPLVASSAATITWATNQSSDSQVEYGLTSSYGTSTLVNSSMVTSHSQGVAGLAANTQYHYRVKSKDSAGNIATSTDFSFTTPAAADTTAPAISGVGASSVTSSAATIGWTTDEASNSQVEYGTTTSYGALSALNSSNVTSHSQALTGLAAGTLYHYRVKSRDAAGNLATSQDFSFSTPAAGDTTPPTVSITSPAAGAHVKGKIKIVAAAADQGGIASVQFQLDGNNLGAADTITPYTTIWNTAGVAQGYHTLTAIARDKAGNATTSAPVSVIIGTVTADVTPPTVSIASPVGGTTVSATVTVSANAGDNVGVVGVQFKLDGVNLGAEDSAAPYSISWDTTASANGTHVLTAVARDAAGNLSTAVGVSVNVSNGTLVQNVVWANLVNVTATGNSIQKTGGCTWCDDAAAISSQQITSGDGYVEFTASETTTNRAIGLSHGSTDTTRSDIDYAVMMWLSQTSGIWAEVYENSVYKSGTAYATGDVFRVAVEGGAIKYYKNGTLWYTSVIAPVYPLLVDTSLWSGGATITNAKILGSP